MLDFSRSKIGNLTKAPNPDSMARKVAKEHKVWYLATFEISSFQGIYCIQFGWFYSPLFVWKNA